MNPAAASPADIVRSYLAAFDSRDPDHIASHVADDFRNRHTSALGSSCDGKVAYLGRLPDFLASMPGLHYEVEQLIADGDHVAAFYTMSGRWQGETAFSVRGIQRLEIIDGRIAERTDYWDSAGFLAQVDPQAAAALGVV